VSFNFACPVDVTIPWLHFGIGDECATVCITCRSPDTALETARLLAWFCLYDQLVLILPALQFLGYTLG